MLLEGILIYIFIPFGFFNCNVEDLGNFRKTEVNKFKAFLTLNAKVLNDFIRRY